MFTISFTQPSSAISSMVGRSRDADSIGVVFLHGWRRDLHDWSKVIELLRDDLSILALDLPGFGDSPEPLTALNSVGYAQAVAEVIREWRHDAGVGRVVVVGHSFGGRVAIELASVVAPELVDEIVLIGVPIIRPESQARSPWGYRLIRSLAGMGVVSKERLERARQRYGSDDYRQARGVMRQIFVEVVKEEYLDHLLLVQRPIWMLWGTLDQACPVALARQAASASSWATLKVLDGVHHLVPLEDPQSIAELITTRVIGS
ncbi:alpha/beta fold hydrolase [Ferrimicrobium sp.]|uniref:alpha/beta fold hydrolase n=1 Tax=Ferrimicrobium sp. TaxID=2926050 RepID=UPI00262DCFF3|nr:alpha/beta hydrolase [Ferrimicrobium sp.]